MRRRLRLEILRQPDDTTCGPTCLHSVYRYHGDEVPLRRLIEEVAPLSTGGTLAVNLGIHALRRGYAATIYTYNLQVFDPSWFARRRVDLAERLRAQAKVKRDSRLRFATDSYLDYLSLGGIVRYEDLTAKLIRGHLNRNRPILTGLSATHLYGCQRERGETKLVYDDVRGVPTGHFVVLYGYDRERRKVRIADPFQENPRFGSHYYSVGIERVLAAIYLGVVTYDANLLVLDPPGAARRSS